MEENYGGPVWHASGRGRTITSSRQICLDALRGVGNVRVGQWEWRGEKEGVVHVARRLTGGERRRYGVPEPYDIRGTDEERDRIAAVYAEAPHLRGLMP